VLISSLLWRDFDQPPLHAPEILLVLRQLGGAFLDHCQHFIDIPNFHPNFTPKQFAETRGGNLLLIMIIVRLFSPEPVGRL